MSIPNSIAEQIRNLAMRSFSEDDCCYEDDVRRRINSEERFYREVMEMDFQCLSPQKQVIIDSFLKEFESWESTYIHLKDEINAYFDLQEILDQRLSKAERKEISALIEREEWYLDKVWAAKKYIEELNNIKRTRRKVDPIQKLLIELETIVGCELYPEEKFQLLTTAWEGGTRKARKPIIINTEEGKALEFLEVPSEISAESLISGRYSAGTHEIHIFKALVKIVDHLKDNYDFDPRARKKVSKKRIPRF